MNPESIIYPRVLTDGHGCLITREDGRTESHYCETSLSLEDIKILNRLRDPAHLGEFAELAISIPHLSPFLPSIPSLKELFKIHEGNSFASRSTIFAFAEYCKRRQQALNGYYISPEHRGDFSILAKDPVRVTLMSNTSAILKSDLRAMLIREEVWNCFDPKIPAILRRSLAVNPALFKVATPQVIKNIDGVTPRVFDDDYYIALCLSAYLPEAKIYMPVSEEAARVQVKKSKLYPPSGLGEVNQQNIIFEASYTRVLQDLMLVRTTTVPLPKITGRLTPFV